MLRIRTSPASIVAAHLYAPFPGDSWFASAHAGGNMYFGRRSGLALLSLWMLACTNTPNTPAVDASRPVDRPSLTDASGRADRLLDATSVQCEWPAALANGALPGCGPARAFVTCMEPGTSSSYATTDRSGCVSCSGTCTEYCSASEFALSCAAALPDAGVSSGPAAGCHFASSFSSGFAVYCCPCQ